MATCDLLLDSKAGNTQVRTSHMMLMFTIRVVESQMDVLFGPEFSDRIESVRMLKDNPTDESGGGKQDY
ncbi:hypothetical protein Pmar_PMAR019945 [Perkinsus marinus ATCC 50983]|uniref:Uncharacterized protein n=1 Tax=Perkinsus marinus (strain ATCC 50983 / TXsc) TaxID=423536 RepID=C5KC32_PERM5|nr:hypothetical protein Pmar_PMAR019945 [Perkinsus marinus ATCC 50983]EER18063.1 hypothetical protein Pmar_PMAR019945 [Perkinsus marinus ATCC 50983]|eukprot:XP_002786267.1 hypothetical protein Pmar_PMAR019945 [Perkinsus marinus ATCC 50983]